MITSAVQAVSRTAANAHVPGGVEREGSDLVSGSGAAVAALADVPGTGVAGGAEDDAGDGRGCMGDVRTSRGRDAVLARYRNELGMAITREAEGDGEQKMWTALADFPHAMPSAPTAAGL